MKIKTQIGNLLHITNGHIVHGCNAQGVMGSGVALGVKNMYPTVFADYERIHKSTGLELGVAYPVTVDSGLVIWNAITQNIYGNTGRMVSYDAIETCFAQINWHLKEGGYNNEKFLQAPELHIPLIGAARGGGNWEIIREIIEQTVEFPVTLWLPDSTVTTL
jgi:O-acetyl-ADP-ribose deacetylase (regulator of RNase III)